MELEATVKEMNWDLTIMNGKMTMRWDDGFAPPDVTSKNRLLPNAVLWYALQIKWALW